MRLWMIVLPLTMLALFGVGCGGGGSAPSTTIPQINDARNLGDDGGDLCPPVIYDLIAGQHNLAGQVSVQLVDDQLVVIFDTTSTNWVFSDTHLHVFLDNIGYTDVPTNKGNPIPGQFDYKETHDPAVSYYEYIIPVDPGWAGEDFLYIAGHAVVADVNTMHIVSDANTMVVDSRSPAMGRALETDPWSQNTDPLPHSAVLAWNHDDWRFLSEWPPDDWHFWFEEMGAEWIWETFRSRHPVEGEIVTFEREFLIPGTPVGGELYSTVDNGHAAWVNGTYIDCASICEHDGVDYPKSNLREPWVDGLGEAAPTFNWWPSVEIWSLSGMVEGTNTLKLVCCNEQMDDGTVDINPAGLIYVAEIDYRGEHQTGWGNDVEFPGTNWATYMEYPVCGDGDDDDDD